MATEESVKIEVKKEKNQERENKTYLDKGFAANNIRENTILSLNGLFAVCRRIYTK